MSEMLTETPVGELPSFANESNKKLYEEVVGRQERLRELARLCSEHRNRGWTIEEHLKNVRKEIKQAQNLLQAKKTEIDSIQHISQLNKQKNATTITSNKNLNTLITQHQTKAKNVQAEIDKNNAKLQKFRTNMQWKTEQLSQWICASQQKQEDDLMVQKYRKADSAKMKEAKLTLDKMTKKVAAVKSALSSEVTDTEAVQMQLDRTAEQFAELQATRRSLIDRWEEGIKSIKQRDGAIAAIARQYASNQTLMDQKSRALAEMNQVLNEQRRNNRDLEISITATQRRMGEIMGSLSSLRVEVEEVANGLEVTKGEVEMGGIELSKGRHKIASLTQILEERFARYNSLMQKNKQLVEEKSQGQKNASEKNEDLKNHEHLLHNVQTSAQNTALNVKQTRHTLFAHNQELNELKQNEVTNEREILGTKAAIKAINSQIDGLEQKRTRQDALIYNIKFESQLLERRVARVTGQRTQKERDELNLKLQTLHSEHAEQVGMKAVLSAQLKTLELKDRTGDKQAEMKNKAKEKLEGELINLGLVIESVARQISSLQNQKQTLLVQQNCVELDVNQLQENFTVQVEELAQVESQKNHLFYAAQEEEKTLAAEYDVLAAKLKLLMDEQHFIAMEVAKRKQQISAMQAKYRTILSKNQKHSEEEGEPSHAYLLIKAAQEQEILSAEGDELNASIKTLEGEIGALENTLEHMIDRNHRYKETLKNAVTGPKKDMEKKEKTEKELNESSQKIADKKVEKKKKKKSWQKIKKKSKS